MQKQGPAYPPSYDQAQGMSNPGYTGADPGPNVPGPVQGGYDGTRGTMFVGGISAVPIMITPSMRVGPYPCTVTCPQCKTQVTTFTRKEAGGLAWMSCGLLAIFGCFLGCCLIPFCMDSCQDVCHSCPNCQAFIGKYSKLR